MRDIPTALSDRLLYTFIDRQNPATSTDFTCYRLLSNSVFKFKIHVVIYLRHRYLEIVLVENVQSSLYSCKYHLQWQQLNISFLASTSMLTCSSLVFTTCGVKELENSLAVGSQPCPVKLFYNKYIILFVY